MAIGGATAGPTVVAAVSTDSDSIDAVPGESLLVPRDIVSALADERRPWRQ
jgi:hypothetical protein